MTKTKRILSVLTALCMLLTLAPLSVFANVTTGKCGTEAFYSYDDVTKTLTINGTGAIKDYTLSSVAPWYDYCEQIESIVIESGITGIGSYAFYWCKGLKSITIPDIHRRGRILRMHSLRERYNSRQHNEHRQRGVPVQRFNKRNRSRQCDKYCRIYILRL
mgnify:CR=1 FL=1